MPKVRLSTMISDIKGKSNGSVFSKNSGGVYFRNNPNGGGKKSANWDKQKNKFASLASSWRGLTNEDQTAWNNATTNYPTTDAFGQTRIPSGYELYMRLNGHMNAVGLPSFTVPNTPRVTPSIGAVNVEYPEFWQLNPKACFGNYDPSGVSSNTLLTSYEYFEASRPNISKSYAFRFIIKELNGYQSAQQNELTIFSVKESNGDGIEVSVKGLNLAQPSIYITLIDGVKILSKYFNVNFNDLFNGSHIAIAFGSLGMPDLYTTWNGQEVTFFQTGDLTATSNFSDYQAYFGQSNQYQLLQLFLSDFRYYNSRITNEECVLVSNGYVLDTELILLDFMNINDGELINYGSLGNAFNFTSGNYTVTSKQIIPISFGLIPLFQIDVQNAGLPDLYLNIYCSPPISNGKTGSFSNFKLLGSFAWDTNLNFVVQQEIKNLFGNIPANCEVRFKIDILDATTGDLVSKNIQPPRKTPRFKAGTDITEKVN